VKFRRKKNPTGHCRNMNSGDIEGDIEMKKEASGAMGLF